TGLEEEFGAEMLATFDSLRTAIADREQGPERNEDRNSGGSGDGSHDTLGGVELCLLAGAAHEVMLYNLSNWGEEVGVASRATFSRTKIRLEDAEILATEKVPIAVGRPRQRLLLGEHGREL